MTIGENFPFITGCFTHMSSFQNFKRCNDDIDLIQKGVCYYTGRKVRKNVKTVQKQHNQLTTLKSEKKLAPRMNCIAYDLW